MLFITSELGRALAVVRVTSQVNGSTKFSGSCHQKSISALKMKFGTADYVGEGNPQPTFCNNYGYRERLQRTVRTEHSAAVQDSTVQLNTKKLCQTAIIKHNIQGLA